MQDKKLHKLHIFNGLAAHRLHLGSRDVVKFVAVDSLGTQELAKTCNHPACHEIAGPLLSYIYGPASPRRVMRIARRLGWKADYQHRLVPVAKALPRVVPDSNRRMIKEFAMNMSWRGVTRSLVAEYRRTQSAKAYCEPRLE